MSRTGVRSSVLFKGELSLEGVVELYERLQDEITCCAPPVESEASWEEEVCNVKAWKDNESANTLRTLAIDESEDDLSTHSSYIDLQEAFPQSTASERKRFTLGFSSEEEAKERLWEYFEFRAKYKLDDLEDPVRRKAIMRSYGIVKTVDRSHHDHDKAEWDLCFCMAMETAQQCAAEDFYPCAKRCTGGATSFPAEAAPRVNLKTFRVPQYVYTYHASCGQKMTCKAGETILHIVPARIDLQLASVDVHALALTLFLGHKVHRIDHKELLHLLVDLRRGKGWPNAKAMHILPMCRIISKSFSRLHPRRINSCLCFPIPFAAKLFMPIFKAVLNKEDRDRLNAVCGSDCPFAAPPKEVLKYIDEDAVEAIERKRKQMYC